LNIEDEISPRGKVCNDPKIVTIFHKHLEHKMHLKISKIKKLA
jgi:hypothetical protein